jgi:hypothetical protein
MKRECRHEFFSESYTTLEVHYKIWFKANLIDTCIQDLYVEYALLGYRNHSRPCKGLPDEYLLSKMIFQRVGVKDFRKFQYKKLLEVKLMT